MIFVINLRFFIFRFRFKYLQEISDYTVGGKKISIDNSPDIGNINTITL